ncbi:hypothetical protein [Mesorhizobium sp. M7A.F.Ca.US.008.03.1.1]|uniref:hypothetical protein n=1 Tax=Mesorhizobium sp. M7A.F.Ca.US.008.03.1.1 TaxID=2496742 RepID=UPI000FCBDFD3|nr:hypothetical protein [Mesorhizobium sp. M7A.F.Ca.US.008.03.1.1]RUW62423.1 hypothetical protein EOA16_09375 [Mesorhizobium sp. M7A.F.Ca.US.008.03.1.1]
MTNFKIVFFGNHGQIVSQGTVPCESHWDACQWGWKNMPSTARDFHAEEASPEEILQETDREDDKVILRAFHILRKRAGLTKPLPQRD